MVSHGHSIHMATKHLLGVYPIVRILLVPWKKAIKACIDGIWRRRSCEPCDGHFYPAAEGFIRGADTFRELYASYDTPR